MDTVGSGYSIDTLGVNGCPFRRYYILVDSRPRVQYVPAIAKVAIKDFFAVLYLTTFLHSATGRS